MNMPIFLITALMSLSFCGCVRIVRTYSYEGLDGRLKSFEASGPEEAFKMVPKGVIIIRDTTQVTDASTYWESLNQ